MAKSRAERLGEFLEKHGWTVFDSDPAITCHKCGNTQFGGKFCSQCGSKLKPVRSGKAEAIETLEEAIGYALHEPPKKK